jgi:serine/threonine protein kinase
MTRTPVAANNDEQIVPTQISQCFNPDCLKINQGDGLLCQYCEEKLLLKERYRALRYLSAGGFAYTFEAVDEHRLNSHCAVKEFVPRQLSNTFKDKAITLFHQEANILKEIGSHPQIPSLLAFLEQEERLYLVEEFIPGENLQEILDKKGLFTEAEIIEILKQILPVLEFIHDRHIIHRDIKPSNIIYQDNGLLTLIDFGSSLCLSREYLTEITPLTGTPGYASPEQMQGQVYPASDLYSLGATVWELLTGFVPLEKELISFSEELISEQIGRKINSDLGIILEKLLHLDYRDRYSTATEVLVDLESTLIQPQQNFNKQSLSLERFSPYYQLESLLATQKYQEADRETWQLLLKLTNREKQGCLTLSSVKQIPLLELEIIDSLWQKYSAGRFGLIVQQEIYQDLNISNNFNYALWQKFGELVGWYQQDRWLNYAELTFNIDAPKGHLPACFVDIFNRVGFDRGVCGWWRLGLITLFNRLKVHLTSKSYSTRDLNN